MGYKGHRQLENDIMGNAIIKVQKRSAGDEAAELPINRGMNRITYWRIPVILRSKFMTSMMKKLLIVICLWFSGSFCLRSV